MQGSVSVQTGVAGEDVMEDYTVTAGREDMRKLAIALLQQAERCALSGLLREAEAILDQVWRIAEEPAPDLANTAAWELAWLLVRQKAYTEATHWFCRVEAPLARASLLWPAAQQMIVQICLGLAERRSEPAAAPPRSPRRQPRSAPTNRALALPMLTVTNLGHFQIARGGRELSPCPAHKAITLFRYLLTRRHHAAHKDELTELLWPDTHAREAANSLHVAVSTLRRHLDPRTGSYVLFEDNRYTINPHAPVENDCTAFQQLSDQGERCWHADDILQAQQLYTQALAWYQGDYYVDTRDLQWAISMQEQLLSRYLIVLDRLGRIYITQGCLERAVECYQRLVERDGYREDAHAQLMRCYSQLHRRGDALRQYERCATILANDLGLEPMQESQALYQEISGSHTH
jgi:DNA-binding SARP family transcriptional activator